MLLRENIAVSTAVQTPRNPLILDPDDDIAAWAWGNRRRRNSFNLLGSRRIFARGHAANRHQTGDSSAGLVMFLAGLVVGAILSTIYFGYTSNNQSIGGGLKELTRQVENATPTALAAGVESDGTMPASTMTGTSDATAQVPGTASVTTSTDYSFYDNLPKAQEPAVIDSGDTQVTVPNVMPPIPTQPVVNVASTARAPTVQPITPAMSAQQATTQQPVVVAAASTTASDSVALATIVSDEQASRMTNSTGDGRLPASSSTAALGSSAAATPAATTTSTAAPITAVTALPVIKKAARREPAANVRTKGMTKKGEFFMLQLAAFGSYKSADKLRARLAINGVESLIQKVGSSRYQVRMGPFIDYSKLSRAEQSVRRLGISPERMLERNRG